MIAPSPRSTLFPYTTLFRSLVNDLIEKGLLGSVALVTTSIPIPAGRPGRHMRHVPRPCNTVFTYSLSLSGKFFYPQPKCLPLLDIASQCPSLPLDCKQAHKTL